MNGKTYVYWEARYTAGYDKGTGKQIQKSISGKTQKEVSQKLKEVTHQLDAGAYIAPSKMTVGHWLDIRARDYLGGVKAATAAVYAATIENHIKPALGAETGLKNPAREKIRENKLSALSQKNPLSTLPGAKTA